MFRISIFGFRIFRRRPPSAETMNHEPLCTNHDPRITIHDPRTINYAKQSQFEKKSNAYNRSFYNELQLKMNNGHLVKTNPIQTQFYPPPADLPAIFFQGFSCIFKSLSSAFLLQSPLFKHFATSGSFLLSSPSDTSPSSLHDG